MLIVHAVFTPLICAATLKTPAWAGLLTFIVTFAYWSVLYISLELEMPFGDDPNDLPLVKMGADFNASLRTLIDPMAITIPIFDCDPDAIDLRAQKINFDKDLSRSGSTLIDGMFKKLSLGSSQSGQNVDVHRGCSLENASMARRLSELSQRSPDYSSEGDKREPELDKVKPTSSLDSRSRFTCFPDASGEEAGPRNNAPSPQMEVRFGDDAPDRTQAVNGGWAPSPAAEIAPDRTQAVNGGWTPLSPPPPPPPPCAPPPLEPDTTASGMPARHHMNQPYHGAAPPPFLSLEVIEAERARGSKCDPAWIPLALDSSEHSRVTRTSSRRRSCQSDSQRVRSPRSTRLAQWEPLPHSEQLETQRSAPDRPLVGRLVSSSPPRHHRGDQCQELRPNLASHFGTM